MKPQSQLPVMLSGIQPTSMPTLGNYLGAVRNWANLQHQYTCFFFTVDLHAIIVPQDPVKLRENTYKAIAFYIAAGIDPSRVTLFAQSHVFAHCELAWILNCFTYMGELKRMTQFKDKSSKQGENFSAGILNYPVLQAADILLYQANFVPVGEDQKQHIELTRDIANRVNQRFNTQLFTIPEPLIEKVGARIMDLQNPTSKMSKSAESPKGVIFLDDSDKDVMNKFKAAMTDSETHIAYDPVHKAGVSNLIEIHAMLSNSSIQDVCKKFEGKMYGHLKMETGELAIAKFCPLRDETQRILKDKGYLDSILKKGAERAHTVALETLSKVKEAVGFLKSGGV